MKHYCVFSFWHCSLFQITLFFFYRCVLYIIVPFVHFIMIYKIIKNDLSVFMNFRISVLNKTVMALLSGLGHLHQDSGKDFSSDGLGNFGSSKKKKKRRHRWVLNASFILALTRYICCQNFQKSTKYLNCIAA